MKDYLNKKGINDNYIFPSLIILIFIVVLFAYSNHFNNSFHFDDSHTIVNNTAIRTINFFNFFSDVTTFSNLPTNQSYRPLTTLENAIDYKIADGLTTKVFHIHIFITFLLVGIFIFFLTKKLLNIINPNNLNKYWALFSAATFCLLGANAETVNYIIQRAEITSALFILIGLLAYINNGLLKKTYLYLIFPLIGFFSKEMAFVFAPLLFLYFLIIENNVDFFNFYKKEQFSKIINSFIKVLPAFLMTVLFLVLYFSMLPKTFAPGGISLYTYFITQPLVTCHYLITFIVPYNLSADTDWTAFSSILNYKAILGFLIIIGLLYFSLKLAKRKETKLISFGILWFFIALIPTSSVLPFAEVLNDHRTFIPYIGLTISLTASLKYLYNNYILHYKSKKIFQIVLVSVITLFLALHISTIRKRNNVWKDGMALWHDVTIKSPKNGRGLMNYGVELMAKGNYKDAKAYFEKALKITPNYPSLHTNLAIINSVTGNKEVAHSYFNKAIALNEKKNTSYYFYGKFLFKEKQFPKAKKYILKSLELSPTHLPSKEFLMKIYHEMNAFDDLKKYTSGILEKNPNETTAKKYLNYAIQKKSSLDLLADNANKLNSEKMYLELGLKYHKKLQYHKAIKYAKKALKIKKDYPEAYNNIGIAYAQLTAIDSAIYYYNKALIIQPDFQLVKNNIEHLKNISENKTKHLLNLSLKYYNENMFLDCITTAEKINKIKPNAKAYNNICAAHNKLKEYSKAIEACKKALALDNSNLTAKANLKYAEKQ